MVSLDSKIAHSLTPLIIIRTTQNPDISGQKIKKNHPKLNLVQIIHTVSCRFVVDLTDWLSFFKKRTWNLEVTVLNVYIYVVVFIDSISEQWTVNSEQWWVAYIPKPPTSTPQMTLPPNPTPTNPTQVSLFSLSLSLSLFFLKLKIDIEIKLLFFFFLLLGFEGIGVQVKLVFFSHSWMLLNFYWVLFVCKCSLVGFEASGDQRAHVLSHIDVDFCSFMVFVCFLRIQEIKLLLVSHSMTLKILMGFWS